MRIDKLKKMLKHHFFSEDSDKRKSAEQYDLLEDAIDECLANGGTAYLRYTHTGPELQLTYPPQTGKPDAYC